MNKKYIIAIILLIILSITWIIIYPIYQEKKEITKLQKEILYTNRYFSNEESLDNLKDYLKEDLTSKNRKDLEKSLDNYINNLLIQDDKLNNIINKNNNLFQNFNKDNQEEITKVIENNQSQLQEIKDNFNKIRENYQDNNEYTKLIKIDSIENKIIKLDEDFLNNQKINNYLKDNNETWDYNGGKLIFLKRKNYEEYQKLKINNISYELIKDTKGPNIIANDVTIIKGTKINIKDKIKCIDDVDDSTECTIKGSYDNNKVGSYKINITSSDKEGNKSEKNIKLIVKEKNVNKNSYYIEVIRNHNIVIVYGLDENNEYKKVVKVFTCSVGKNNKTPTGTFKTSDKASWGWLVGNVYGQYYTRITGNILFHSVPYYKKDKSTLEWEEYNKLGEAASKGCIRLSVADAKWIYNNCKSKTTVKIYDGDIPNGITKPKTIKINADSLNKGWDPTDPDKNNPWKN